MQEMKIDLDFCALLLSNSNPDMRKLKVDANKHIFITKFDVE